MSTVDIKPSGSDEQKKPYSAEVKSDGKLYIGGIRHEVAWKGKKKIEVSDLKELAQVINNLKTKTAEGSLQVKEGKILCTFNETSAAGKVHTVAVTLTMESPKGVVKNTTTSLLERFAELEKHSRTPSDQIKNVLASFFGKIVCQFKMMERHFLALIDKSYKYVDPSRDALRRDINLLAEICGAPPVEGMTMLQSLTYMLKMLEREKKDVSNPEVHSRLKIGVEIGEKIASLRNSYSERKAKSLVNDLQNRISNIQGNEKILFPSGFIKNGKLIEALLEVSKDPSGKCRVAFISANDEIRDLFDQEALIQTGSQSIRREITNVDVSDLLAAIPTFIELQTSPLCIKQEGTSWQNVLVQTLRFDQSQVEVGALSESYTKGKSLGHLGESISYIKAEQQTPEEGKRFDVAIRLRIFLDLCKSNKQGLKDPEFWKSVRTTALHLVSIIEREKESLGTETEQGRELMRIYGELSSLLEELENSPPQLGDFREKSFPLLSGDIEAKSCPNTPALAPSKTLPHVFPEVEQSFAVLDPKDPQKSIENWGARVRALIAIRSQSQASCEALLMVHMLPPISNPFWKALSSERAEALLKSFNNIGEAIARGAVEKSPAPIYDITAMTILNWYTIHVACQLRAAQPTFRQDLGQFIVSAAERANELINCKLSKKEHEALVDLMDSLVATYSGQFGVSSRNDLVNITCEAPKAVESSSEQVLLNMNQFTYMTMGVGGNLRADVNGNQPLTFSPSYDNWVCLHGNSIWEAKIRNPYEPPLNLRAPPYAHDVSHEVANRYVTEFCCFGCIRDNCDNYNMTAKENMRFHPLYMLHNFVDIFCNKLSTRGDLRRDELADLMYTQQTNQNAKDLYQTYGDGREVARGFDNVDRTNQLRNAFLVYLEHPHFFKHPDLRWHFENKIFTNTVFYGLCTDNKNKPFITGAIERLKKELKIAIQSGDKEIAGYLLHLLSDMRDEIMTSAANESDKKYFTSLFPTNSSAILMKWAEELIGKNDEFLLNQQAVILPLVLQNYYKKFIEDNNNPCFDSNEEIERILCAAVQIESNENLKNNIDIEIYARCKEISSFALTKLAAKVKAESAAAKGSFINKILFRINPLIGKMGLQWDPSAFPTFSAKDELGKIYYFDAITGKVTFEANTCNELPENVKHSPGMERLFGKALGDTWKVDESLPESKERIVAYTHEKFPEYRIVVRRPTYGLVSTRPQIIIEKKLPESFGKDNWVIYTEFVTQNQLRNNANALESKDLPLTVALAIGDRTCWIDRERKTCYVFNDDSNELYATMGLTNGLLTGLQVSDLHIVKEDTHLLACNTKEMEQFSAIENPNFIMVLGKKNHAATVVYSRYEMATDGAPLSYDITKEGVSSKAFPKYMLAAYGVKPGSADPAFGVRPLPITFDGYHLLQKDGEEKVLIPCRGFEQKMTIAGDSLPTSTTVFPEEYEKCPMYEFTVNKETNRLTAKSGDAYAYLAYLCMAHWDYESSAYYLSKARTTAGYDVNYDKVFEWAKEWQDTTPNGIAMALRFNLFREAMMDDTEMRHIREGSLQKSEAIALQRTSRLIQIADLYATLRHKGGVDSALSLTSQEEAQVKRLIKTLLVSNGTQFVETNEPKPVIAQEAFLQNFLIDKEIDPLGTHKDALFLWACNGTKSDNTPLTVKHPKWIALNFRNLFNQIMAADVKSVQFKQLYQQIRIITELPLDEKTKREVGGAEMYLLKLMTAKETNSKEFQELQSKLAPKNRLEALSGPLFNRSRVKALERMKIVLKQYVNTLALGDKNRAREQVEVMVKIGQHKGEKDPYKISSLGKKMVRFIDRWEKDSKPPNFKDAMKIFLMNEVYGSGGARGITSLQNVFDLLDPVEIKQPVQEMKARPASPPQPALTFFEKYSPLLDSPPVHNDTKIKWLEEEITSLPAPVTPVLVTTAPENIHAVIGDDMLAKHTKEYFLVSENPAQSINQELFDELGQSDEKAFKRVAERHREDLNEYLKLTKTTATITKENAEKLKVDLVQQREELTKEEESLKRNLLQYVDNFASPAGIVAMRRLVGKGVKPSLDMLIALWRRGETAKPWEDHPLKKLGLKKIGEESLKKIDNDIARYLELSTRNNHFNRVIGMADKYVSICEEKNPDPVSVKQLANELFEGVRTKRNYNAGIAATKADPDYRDLLYVEYTQKIIMYADQIETLREMNFDPNAVRQLRMGRGKTEVIMPILAKKKATGKNLVMLMLPEELYEANCRGLDIKNRILFGQDMHRFEFSRKTDKSVEALEKIHINLLETIRDKGFVMTTKKSLLSLKDSYVLLLNKLTEMKPDENKDELLKQIRAMSKIVSLIYNQGDVLADEVDACLDVRKEVNFALGDPEKVDQVKGDVAAELMQMILGQKESELKNALLQNTQAALSPEKRTSLLRALVSDYFDAHKDRLVNVSKESFVAHIMNEPDLGSAAEQWILSQKELNNGLYKQISTLKALVNQGFGMTLGKVGNVNYGRDPVSGTGTIPYKASNTPSISSEFDDDIERICFTYQDYLQNGVTYKQMYAIVAKMQHRAIEELKKETTDEFQSINDMEAAKEFKTFLQEIDPEKKLPVGVSLSSMCDPKMIETLVAVLNRSPKGLLTFCHKQVIGNMRQYSAQISAMSTEAPELVKNFGGFTGTPWNIHTYHDKINAKASKGVDGSTWALMLGRDIETKVFDFNADKPIESLVENTDMIGKSQALADAGAYLRGTNNVDFIDHVLKTSEESKKVVSAGIYFDSSGKIVKKQTIEEKPLPIDIAPSTDMMTTITLYDQAHTVGADITQGKKANLVVTIGENTFIRDLFQAVWRMRQLHLEQTVTLAVSSKIKERILKGTECDLSTQEGMNTFCREIYKFCLMNEARREADDNFKAEKEKIQGAAKRQLLPTIAGIITDGTSDDTITAMAQKFAATDAQLFIKKRAKEEAYDGYTKLKKLEAPIEVLTEVKKTAVKKSMEIAGVFEELQLPEAQGKFAEISKALLERSNRPEEWFENRVGSDVVVGGEVEQEAQAETEQELELMVQIETQVQTEVEAEVCIPIAPAGEAGHGNVFVMTKEAIDCLQKRNAYNTQYMRPVDRSIPFFDTNIYTSSVFERNLPTHRGGAIAPQSVFYSNRKPVKYVQITKNEKGTWNMIIPTIHEAHEACRSFIEETELQSVVVAISTDKPLLVYKSGDDRSNALSFANAIDQEKFYTLYVQAKLFNGEIEFNTKEEQQSLKKWLLKKGVAEFKSYFENSIVAAKPRRYIDNYPKSSLFKIFQELAEKPKMTDEEIEALYPVLAIVEPKKPAEEVVPKPQVEPTPVEVPPIGVATSGYPLVADLTVVLIRDIWAQELTVEEVKRLTDIVIANESMIKNSNAKAKAKFFETIKEFRKAIKKSTKIGPGKDELINALQQLASRCLGKD